MNLNQPTLVQFEQVRNENNFVPIVGSNSFFEIGDGKINLLTDGDHIGVTDDPHFVLSTYSGHVYTGAGTFEVSSAGRYRKMNIIAGTELSVNQELRISGATLTVNGKLELMRYSRLIVENGGTVILAPGSEFVVSDDVQISVNGGLIDISGTVNIHLSYMDKIYTDGINIDTAATVNVMGLEQLGERAYSMTDYLPDLHKMWMAPYSQGEHNHKYGRIGYRVIETDDASDMRVIELKTLSGESILGDFKIFVLGESETPMVDTMLVNRLTVCANSTLYISETFYSYRYVKPELCIGAVISATSKIPGRCVVEGTMIAEGYSASINIDRNSILEVKEGGVIQIKDHAKLNSVLNDPDQIVLIIDGTLIIDSIEQLNGFDATQISIGNKGRIVILNPSPKEETVLLSIPMGIKGSELYRLFGDRLDKVEYHITKNTGITIDKYYEDYSKEMVDWYNGIRIEKAVHDKLIVWESGAFILLDHTKIPWVDGSCTLRQAARIFKGSGYDDASRLKDVVGRLQYAGFDNITFIFKNGTQEKRLVMSLEQQSMINSLYEPNTRSYKLITTGECDLFLRNHANDAEFDTIVNQDSTHLIVSGKSVNIPI